MERKDNKNLYSISYKTAKEYLDFINEVFSELEHKRKTYLDFHHALIEQKANQNLFISWCMDNYYKTLILNLCKLIEPRKNDKNKYTLKHFINLLKYEKNYEMLKNALLQKTVDIHDLHTGEIEKESVANEYLKKLESINFNNDIKIIEEIHKKIEDYRNKRLAHNDNESLDIHKLPGISELHADIDKIQSLMFAYFGLFGIYIDYDSFKIPRIYGNFHLTMR